MFRFRVKLLIPHYSKKTLTFSHSSAALRTKAGLCSHVVLLPVVWFHTQKSTFTSRAEPPSPRLPVPLSGFVCGWSHTVGGVRFGVRWDGG